MSRLLCDRCIIIFSSQKFKNSEECTRNKKKRKLFHYSPHLATNYSNYFYFTRREKKEKDFYPPFKSYLKMESPLNQQLSNNTVTSTREDAGNNFTKFTSKFASSEEDVRGERKKIFCSLSLDPWRD